VYVNAFTLLARDAPPPVREFSLAAASLADSLGVACADVAGVLIQVRFKARCTALLFHLPALNASSSSPLTGLPVPLQQHLRCHLQLRQLTEVRRS
jgi:hypothetical protein